MKLPADDTPERADGSTATASEEPVQQTLGERRAARRVVVDRARELERQLVVGARLEPDRPLARRGQQTLERLGDGRRLAEPVETGAREEDPVERLGVVLGELEPLQARLDVAADLRDLEVRTEREHLGRAPGARRAESRPPGELEELLLPARAQDVPVVGPRERRREDEPLPDLGREVLERVNREVHVAALEGLLELLGEGAGPELGDRGDAVLVALGLHDLHLDRHVGTGARDRLARQVRLRARERAAARSEEDRRSPG